MRTTKRTNIIEHLMISYADRGLALREEYMSCLDATWDNIEYWLDCPLPFIRFLLLPRCIWSARRKGRKLGITARAVILMCALAEASMSVTMLEKKLGWSKRAIKKYYYELFGMGYAGVSILYEVEYYNLYTCGMLSILLGKYIDYSDWDMYMTHSHGSDVYFKTVNYVLQQHGFSKIRIPAERKDGLFSLSEHEN